MPVAKIVEIALAALGVLPSVIDAVADLIDLRNRIQAGGGVTEEELDAMMARIIARSARIQSS